LLDSGNSRIQKFTSEGKYLTDWNIDGIKRGPFASPPGIDIDFSGNVYIANTTGHHIIIYRLDGSYINSWGENGLGDGQFSLPNSVAVDPVGNVYVLDSGNSRIQKFTSEGEFITKWGGQGSDDGKFNMPSDISVDLSSGNVYVLDSGNSRIQKFTSEGEFITKWNGSQGTSDGQFNRPSAIDIHPSSGNVYVADSGNSRIQVFAKANQPPVANGIDVTTDENKPVNITLIGTDPDNNSVRFSIVTEPLHGTLGEINQEEGIITYTPDLGFVGKDSFTYKVNDGTKDSNTATASVTISSPPNNIPKAESQKAITGENKPVDITLKGIDSDNTDTLTFFIDSEPLNGQLSKINLNSGKVTYTPATNFTGKDSFAFKVNDGKADSNIATVSIMVYEVNKYPVANAGRNITVNEGTFVSLNASNSQDPDGDTLTYNWRQTNTQGSSSVALGGANKPLATFTAPSNLESDNILTFELTVNDGKGGTGTDIVEILVKDSQPDARDYYDEGSTLFGSKRYEEAIEQYDKALAINPNYIDALNAKGGALYNLERYTEAIEMLDKALAIDPNSEYAVDVKGKAVARLEETKPILRTEEEEYLFVRVWGSEGTENGQLDGPEGIAIDSSGNVYVADTNRIQKFTADGKIIKTWYSSGLYGIAVDSSDNVYVSDNNNNRIQKFTADGKFITSWGSSGTENGQFDEPEDIAVDSSDNVYVADFENNRIQKFTADGKFIKTWYSSGSSGVAIDSSGNVYVSDYGNDRIQKFTADGKFIPSWGSSGTENGQFNEPEGIAIDSSGNVYVADSGNNRIQKFTAEGKFITSWGSEGTENGQLDGPEGVAIDSSGNVYVADTYNNRIQIFAPGN
jgi:DNA-binding beta-propeller fold protein YncE